MYDTYQAADHCHFMMEYVQGKDLYDYLSNRNFKLSENLAKRIIYCLLQGVKHLHSMGILHRDLKLENIMMSDKSDKAIPKIVDFGLSKLIAPNQKATESYGTVGYVAPEVMCKTPYAHSCDIWSLGCIFYALMCGSLPYNPSKEFETSIRTIREHTIFGERQWLRVSNECKELIGRMLYKDPCSRINVDQALKHRFFDSVRNEL